MPQKKLVLPKGTLIPHHIALILDGNRRWARSRGLYTLQGHKAGFEAARRVANASRDFGIHTFTVWGFSTENWDREEDEIRYLMGLFKKFVREVRDESDKDQIRFVHLGRKDRLPKDLIALINKTEAETAHHTKHVLNVALDYGGRDEILRAVKEIVREGIPADKITEAVFASHLDTRDQPYPYPDLFIRPSGEQRTSGLLPWQLEYAEYYWETSHLPDMTPEKLMEAILDYSRRRRRFGGNDSVEHLKFKPEVIAKLEVKWWRLAHIPEGTKFKDYAMNHLKEQWGLSKILAKEAAVLMVDAFIQGEGKKWQQAQRTMKEFYDLIKSEAKLAFEPALAAKLQVNLWQKAQSKETANITDLDITSRQFVSEVYRISDLQAAKAAHLMSLATLERSLAKTGENDPHWQKAEDYLEKYYSALRDRVS